METAVLKRAFDIIVSLLLLLAALPAFLVIAVLIKLDSRGPVIYRGPRVGKDRRPFAIYKFRTMVVDAPKRGPGITRDADPRITRVGWFLRKLKIDEMPQLVNVLKGEMSIIGPRPEDPRYVAYYSPEQQQVLSVRPGLASPASIKYRREEEILAQFGGDWEKAYIGRIMPDKLGMDLDYIRRASLPYDLSILFQAVVCVFTSRTS